MLATSLILGLWGCTPASQTVEVADPLPTPATPEGGAIVYELGFPDAHTHYFEVAATVPTLGAETVELYMANWTPGSYLIRDYARHVEGLQASVPIQRTSKNRWTAQTGGVDAIQVNYRVYAREMGVQTNFVDADMAMLNGASTFLTAVGMGDRPHDIRVALPEGWSDVAVALPPVPDATEEETHAYRAADFDTLVDSPLVAGNLSFYRFEVEGVPHALVNVLEDEMWDGPKSAKDVETITKLQTQFWGSIPYDQYLYLNVIGETRGGLEHKASTLMLTSRWKTRDEDAYKGWLGLVSHEFFHTWNVKRLRPEALGPFDYENEVYTADLWVAEGFTSYYDDLLLLRAGLIDEDDWLERMGGNIRRVQTTPGRQVRTLAENSRDAWFKLYNRDENTQNTSLSYYTKGAVVAWLLDARIREATAGQKSLDDVMRLAYDRYSDEQGFTTQQFRDVCSEVARTDLTDFFASTVDSTDELDYSQALAWFGFEMAGVAEEPEADPEDTEEASDEEGWIGLELSGGTVRAPLRGTPAFDAGFSAGDELLAIDGFCADSTSRVSRYQPGETIEVLISRRGKLRSMTVTVGKEPKASWSLTRVDDDPGAVSHRKALLATPQN